MDDKFVVVAEIPINAPKEIYINDADCRLGMEAIKVLKEARGEPVLIRIETELSSEQYNDFGRPCQIYKGWLKFNYPQKHTYEATFPIYEYPWH